MFFSRFRKRAKKTETVEKNEIVESTKSGFKVGDYVLVKDGLKLENGEFTDNWAGKIVELYDDENVVNITFDAITLNHISDDYLVNCDETGGDHYSYNFYAKELTKIKRRDTKATYKAAAKAYDLRFAALTDDPVTWEEQMQEKWFGMFAETPFFEQLTDHQKENADFAIEVFTHYYFNYMDKGLMECTPYDAEEMCTDILARKVSAERDFYEALGPIIGAFFEFLSAEGYFEPKDAREIKEHLLSIENKIIEASEDPSNWGMAKSFMMQGQSEGYDMSSQEDLDAFMRKQQLGTLRRLQQEHEQEQQFQEVSNGLRFASKPYVNQDPYKDFKRNTKVSVRYQGGKVKEHVSFKRVEKDLRSGKCELI